MNEDLDKGLSWIMVDPRVTSRGPSSPPECLSLSIRLLPDVGATNEIKTLAFSEVYLVTSISCQRLQRP